MPLLYVPGNHDPSVELSATSWMPLRAEIPIPGPPGCDNIEGRVVEARGLRIAGLGGSLRYKRGPNQYTQAQMSRRAFRLGLRVALRRARRTRKLDVLLTHAPPFGLVPATDAAHAGFVAFSRLIGTFHPLVHVHGHVHPYGRASIERRIGPTRVVNAIPWRMIELG